MFYNGTDQVAAHGFCSPDRYVTVRASLTRLDGHPRAYRGMAVDVFTPLPVAIRA